MSVPLPPVLVVDDEKNMRLSLRTVLADDGYAVRAVESAEEALTLLGTDEFFMVITDARLGGISGYEFLGKARNQWPDLPILMITAYATPKLAVEAIKAGAIDYLAKPFAPEELLHAVGRCAERHRLLQENASLRVRAGETYRLDDIVGDSPKMRELRQLIQTVAPTDARVLVLGESGTGKELVAGALHSLSHRGKAHYVRINCAAIPETLLESELFGHEKGAFTGAVRQKPGKFEVAGGGTVFLDEVGEISLSAQVKLLRFLEDRKFERVGGTESIGVDVRIVSATNQNLEERVREGRFREDLYFRLNVVRIDIPPLRERREDVPLLVAYFLDLARGAGVTTDALDLMKNHSWPGNVRELRNAIERGVVLARGTPIRSEHLPETVTSPRPIGESDLEARIRELVEKLVAQGQAGDLYRHVEARWEKALLRRVLEQTGSNQVKAAELLGINRMTLRKKMEQHGL